MKRYIQICGFAIIKAFVKLVHLNMQKVFKLQSLYSIVNRG